MFGLGPETQGWALMTISIISLVTIMTVFLIGVRNEKKLQEKNDSDQH